MESKTIPPKTQIRVTRSQKRMKVLLEFKEALITVARFTENPALDAGYLDLGKQIDLMIIREGREQEAQVSPCSLPS